jgi:NADH dehydrogenase [ubiquinone] 1 alpha subcomplex assembly factor 7
MASALEAEIRTRAAANGPISVAEYMGLCLAHYYGTRDPLGARGDFVTAPEVSQMFGELIGLWLAAVWQQMRGPSRVRVVELGPGRGTLVADALWAAKIVPGFREAISLHLVEISPVLQAKQRETLRDSGVPVMWHERLEDVPDGPAIIVANEFFDALPVHQAMKRADGWHERRVGVDGDRLVFTEAPETLPGFEHLPLSVSNAHQGAIFEWRDEDAARALGKRVAQGGAALVIDYGHAQSAIGDTLQAVGAHSYANPLSHAGEIDLTAHVDFEALIRTATSAGAKAFAPITQGELLRRLGIEARAAKLKQNATAKTAADIDAALARLTGSGRNEMGRLFKSVAFADSALGAVPGFEQ